MLAVITVIVVGAAAAFILSRSRRQHRPIGAFRSSSDSTPLLALGESDDPDQRHDDGAAGESPDTGDSGGGDSGANGGGE